MLGICREIFFSVGFFVSDRGMVSVFLEGAVVFVLLRTTRVL